MKLQAINDTSYRIDVSPTGEILAAALVYSNHTRNTRPGIVRDRWGELLAEDEEIRFIKTSFEDPDSPYFLNARSPRSNISTGGNLIPLLGPGSQAELTHRQMDILDRHRIDPHNPVVPADIAEQVSVIGEATGRYLHPILGVDILRPYVIDVNPGPGNRVYTECWNTGTDAKHNIISHRLNCRATSGAIARFRASI